MLYRFARALFRFYFNVFNRLKVKGKENIVKDGPLIVFANHYSDADAFILPTLFDRQIRFMAKKSLLETPIVRTFAKAYGAFPVDRDAVDVKAIKTSLKILKDGGVLGIFPEGTRIRDEKESNPKGGFAMIAYKTKTTLQPVRIKYKHKAMIFNTVEVIIDKPISPEEFVIDDPTAEGYEKASRSLMQRVYDLE